MKKIVTFEGTRIESLDDLPNGKLCVTVRGCPEELPNNDMTIKGTWSKSQIDAMARGLIDADKKIPAVKLVRAVTGWGLYESKYYVDNLKRESVSTYTVDLLHNGEWGNKRNMTLDSAINMFLDFPDESITINGYCLWGDCFVSRTRVYGVTYEGDYVVCNTSQEEAIKVFREKVQQ